MVLFKTWDVEFELLDGCYSVSDIQDCMNTSLKKHEKLTTIPIHVYIKGINIRLVFKIKVGYEIELQTPKTMKLFGSTKKLIDKTKTGQNILSLEVGELVSVQSNLVDNQYQKKSEVQYTFMPNKSYAYLLMLDQVI